ELEPVVVDISPPQKQTSSRTVIDRNWAPYLVPRKDRVSPWPFLSRFHRIRAGQKIAGTGPSGSIGPWMNRRLTGCTAGVDDACSLLAMRYRAQGACSDFNAPAAARRCRAMLT